ncbi:MAG: hypothetical protein QOF19_3098 [Alphaproteobacteria bacterium]|nr:hypothetical protein [Alphaproteobacteria bacterium]MEA2977578.1 hypothetical protein [Alphaproteobacteria bacterium]
MKKAKKTKTVSNDKPSAFLAAGYKVVQFSNGSLLLQRGNDLRLFHFSEHRDGGDPVHGTLAVSFVAKVP